MPGIIDLLDPATADALDFAAIGSGDIAPDPAADPDAAAIAAGDLQPDPVPAWGEVESHPDYAGLSLDDKLGTIDGWASQLIDEQGAALADEAVTFANDLRAELRFKDIADQAASLLESRGQEVHQDSVAAIILETAGDIKQYRPALRGARRKEITEQDDSFSLRTAIDRMNSDNVADANRAGTDWQTVPLGEMASFELRPTPHPSDQSRYLVRLPDGSEKEIQADPGANIGSIAKQVAKANPEAFPHDVNLARDVADRVVRGGAEFARQTGRGGLTGLWGAAELANKWHETLGIQTPRTEEDKAQALAAFNEATQFEGLDRFLDSYFPTSQAADAAGAASTGRGIVNDALKGVGQMPLQIGTVVAGGPVFGPMASFTVNTMASGQEAFDDAVASGRTDEALQAFASVGPVNAMLETASDVVLGGMFGKALARNLDTVSPGLMGRFQQGAKAALKGGTVEGATEAAQTTTLNSYARQFYDENRAVFKGVPESAAVGMLVGGFVGSVAGSAQAGGDQASQPARPASSATTSSNLADPVSSEPSRVSTFPREQETVAAAPFNPIGEAVDQLMATPAPQPTIEGSPAIPDTVEGASIPADTAAKLPLQQQPDPNAKPIDAPTVIDAIANVAQAAGSSAPLRTGNLSDPKRNAGEFHVQSEVARIKTANDIETAAHEIGHAVQKGLYGNDKQKFERAIPHVANRELTELGKILYPDGVPTGGYVSEGFAEYMRLYTAGGRQHAAEVVPQFDAWFAGELETRPKLASAMRQASETAVRFNKQGAWNRGEQGIVNDGILQRAKDLKENMNWNTVNRAWFDNEETLRRYFDEASTKAAAQGKQLEANGYETAEARRMSGDAIVGRWLDNGMTDRDGNEVGPALSAGMKPVRGKMREFMVYLWARRTRALAYDPDGPRNSGLAVQDANTIVTEAEQQFPQFKAAAEAVYDWNDGVLDYVASFSPDFAEIVDRIRNAEADRDGDRGAYIPLQREFKQIDKEHGSIGSSEKGGTAFKRLSRHGSGRRIKNPLESLISAATAHVQKAHEKQVIDQIVDAAYNPDGSVNVEGLGKWVNRVPRHMLPAAQSNALELLTRIEDKMETQLIVDDGQGGQIPATESPNLSDLMLTMFAPATSPKKGDNPILPYIRNGELQFYEMDADLYNGIAGMAPTQLHWALNNTLGLGARTLRLGATGVNAGFSLVTNPIRDFQTFAVNSRSDANIGKLFTTYMGSMIDNARHILSGGKYSTREIELFENFGGVMSQMLRQDTNHTKRATRRMFQTTPMRLLDPRNGFDFLREVLSFPETAARTAEIKLLTKKVGWEPGQAITEAQAIELVRAAKIVTTDFTAGGDYARIINQVSPFFNAQLQGPRAHVRAIKDHPGRFMVRGLQLTALALLNWYRNKDKTWWQEMPTEQRYGYSYVETELNGRAEVMRIPRSFELGGIYMALAETMADAWYQQDPQGLEEHFRTTMSTSKDWAQVFAENSSPFKLNPLLMNPLSKEVIEQTANRDTHFDQEIVSKTLEHRPPHEQYRPYTTRLAIKLSETSLGKHFNFSPVRIDHAIRSLSGGTGADLAAAFGRGPSKEAQAALDARETEPANLPVIGRLFLRGGDAPRNSTSIDGFYDRLEAAALLKNSFTQDETEAQRDVRLQMNDARDALTALAKLEQMALSVQERRDLQKLKVQTAREANKAFDSTAVNREHFKAWRERWQGKAKAKAKAQATTGDR